MSSFILQQIVRMSAIQFQLVEIEMKKAMLSFMLTNFFLRLYIWNKMTMGDAVLLWIPINDKITFCDQYHHMAPQRVSCM